MGHLIFAHGNEVAFINQNVGSLQHRVSEEAIGAEIFFADVFPLLLIRRDTLKPAQRSDHGKQKMQFGMLWHMRLDKHGAAVGIESGC